MATVELLEDERGRHEYRVNGVIMPSVTTITRFISREKQDAAPVLQREAAADRGKRVHEYCQLYDYGALPDEIDADCVGYVQGYIAFLRDYRIKEWMHSELALADDDCAGTLDRVGGLYGNVLIADLKCTATMDKRSLAAQLWGYKRLWDFNHSDRLAGMLWGVQLKKDGKYMVYDVYNRGQAAFESCLYLHKYLKEEWPK